MWGNKVLDGNIPNGEAGEEDGKLLGRGLKLEGVVDGLLTRLPCPWGPGLKLVIFRSNLSPYPKGHSFAPLFAKVSQDASNFQAGGCREHSLM